MIGTSLASLSRPLWRVLERHQINPEFVFREAGLDPALMDESRSRFQAERVAYAWRKAAELITDPCFGLEVADAWFPTDFHALGYAFLASSTLRTGLNRLCRYVDVVDNAVGFVTEGSRHPRVLVAPALVPDAQAPAFSNAVGDGALGESRVLRAG